MSHTTIVQALNAALRQEMRRDPTVFLLGEDIGAFGGAYTVTKGLYEEFGAERVRDTPISEAAIIGAAIGAALTGMRPVAEIQFNDFLTCAMDQIVNQAAKIHLMSGGQAKVPIVIRAPVGATGRAAQHSQSLEAFFMHTPGLKVVVPSTPYDAKGLLVASIRDDNPVLFFEHKLLYGGSSPGGKAKSVVGEMASFLTPAPDAEYIVSLGKAQVRREGSDLTVVATLFALHQVLALAEKLSAEGVELEVIDPRTLSPFDIETVVESVKKTARLLVVSEDVECAGVASEIATQVMERAFDSLDAPIARISTMNAPVPFSPRCEAYILPGQPRIEAAIRNLLG